MKAYKDRINFSQLLGVEFVNRTYKWFCETSGTFGFIAFVDDNPAGFIVGSEFIPHRKLNLYRVNTGIIQIIKSPQLLISKSLIREVINRIKRHIKGSIDIDNKSVLHKYGEFIYNYSIANLPQYSHLRIADLLLEKCELYAREKNKKVVIGNVGASNISSLMCHRIRNYIVDNSLSDEKEIILYKKI